MPWCGGFTSHRCIKDLSLQAQAGCWQRHQHLRQENQSLRFSFAYYMILLPLMSIPNSSRLLSTCIYQLLGKKKLLFLGILSQALVPAAACSTQAGRGSCLQEHTPCTLPGAAAVSVLLWGSRIGKLSCSCCPVSLSGSCTRAVCPGSPRAGLHLPVRTSASPRPCGAQGGGHLPGTQLYFGWVQGVDKPI